MFDFLLIAVLCIGSQLATDKSPLVEYCDVIEYAVVCYADGSVKSQWFVCWDYDVARKQFVVADPGGYLPAKVVGWAERNPTGCCILWTDKTGQIYIVYSAGTLRRSRLPFDVIEANEAIVPRHRQRKLFKPHESLNGDAGLD